MEWKPFPLLVLTTEDKEIFVLPGDRDFKLMDENIARLNDDADRADKRKDHDTAKMFRSMAASQQDNENRLKEYRDGIVKSQKLKERPYELGTTSFGEYLSAEEDAKDWVSGEPRINDGRLSLNLMSDRIRLDGKTLNRKEIEALDYPVAAKLWSEMKAMVYPNVDRLPFLSLPATSS